MFSRFAGVEFGGDLFSQWPVGLRFEVGLEQVWRAAEIHEFIHGRSEDCILISQDWLTGDADICGERCTPLFSTPGVLPIASPQFQTVDVSPFDQTPYRLIWTRLPLHSLNAAQMFQAIANRERGGIPAIRSGVYTIDDRAVLIMHMYDDRGLDIIAANAATLLPVYERFGGWILDNQRHKIDLRFKEFVRTLEDPTSEVRETD
jgi:hypothetical protein